jgi:hypothetical protein
MSDAQLLKLELLGRIGEALLQIQRTEEVLKRTVTYFLRAGSCSWVDLLSQEERERKRTLGYFLRELRRYTPIRPDFDEELTRFLSARNTFVHDLLSVEGFNLDRTEGLLKGLDFIADLNKQAVHIRKVLWGLVQFLMDDTIVNGLGPGVTEEQGYALAAIGIFLQSDFWDDDAHEPI